MEHWLEQEVSKGFENNYCDHFNKNATISSWHQISRKADGLLRRGQIWDLFFAWKINGKIFIKKTMNNLCTASVRVGNSQCNGVDANVLSGYQKSCNTKFSLAWWFIWDFILYKHHLIRVYIASVLFLNNHCGQKANVIYWVRNHRVLDLVRSVTERLDIEQVIYAFNMR